MRIDKPMLMPFVTTKRPPLSTSRRPSSPANRVPALFSWFVSFSSRYALVYGYLASLILLLVWLYFCGNILLLGAVMGRVWQQRLRRSSR